MIIDSPIISGSYAASGSLNQLGNVVISGSLTVTGSIIGTASYAETASNALTASYLSGYISPFPFTGSAIISGSLAVTGSILQSGSFTSTGTITAQTLVVQTITSSVVYSSGSNIFGNDLANTQRLTGSVSITGSLAVNGSNVVLSNQTSSMSASYALNATSASYAADATTASYAANATSASYANNANSASYALTASFSLNVPVTSSYANNANSASYADTASFVTTAQTASFVVTAQTASFVTTAQTASFVLNAVSASFATTASYVANASSFPFTGSAVISGSLGVTGSFKVTNLGGSGVRYLVADDSGSVTAQSASAALKSTQAFTSTAGQTTFAVTNGYSTGYVDVFINGSKLATAEFTDTSGTNIVLATGSFINDTVEVVKYTPAAGVTNNVLRQLTTFTASAAQTVFSASYTPGLIDIFYNGSRLTPADFTANNGTFFTLATASAANDILDVLVYSYQVGAFSGIGGVGTADQIAYFGTTNSITGSPNFTISGSTMLITGSLTISGSSTFTNIGPAVFSGSITSTAGFTGSFSGTATSASYAANAELLDGLDSTVFTLTSSFTAQTASFTAFSSSVNSFTASQNVLNGTYTLTSSFAAQTASFTAFTASILAQTSSLNSFSASVLTYTASQNVLNGTYATTGSNTFIGTQTISGSVLQSGSFTSTGTLTAQTLVVQTITSSVVYSSGSNIFGNDIANTQTFTGSVNITGSQTIYGNLLNTNSNFQTYGSASFGVSTWGLSIGNGNASANYYRANDHYFQNGAGTQTLQIASTGAATFSSSVTANGIIQAALPSGLPATFELYDSGGGTDLKYWRIESRSTDASYKYFSISSFNDALNSLAYAMRIRVPASSITPDQVLFPNGNVGIGTSSPQRTLCIANGGANVEIDAAGGTAGPIYFNYNRSTSTYLTPEYWALSHKFMANGGTLALTIASTGAATFSSSVTATGGYFYGQTINSFVRLDNNVGAQIGYLNYADICLDSLGIFFKTASNTTTVTRLFITTGGNVGIGTVSPDVTGFGYTTLTIKGGTTSGYAGVLELQTATTNANGQNVGIMAFLDGSSRNAQISVQRATSTSTADMMFYTNAGAGIVERMRITSDGDVGIGTATPSSLAGYRYLSINATSGGILDLKRSGTSQLQISAEGSGTYFSGPTSVPMIFTTSNTERMRITSTGEIGIGSIFDEPYALSDKLRVKGGAIQVIGGEGDSVRYRTLISSPLNFRHFYIDVSGNSANQVKVFFGKNINGTETDFMTLNDGNVLIGTTTDDTINKLQVNGGIASTKFETNFNTTTINSSTNVNTAVLDIGIVCFRDATNGGGCVVFYENGQTPVIISQSGGTTFTTSSPSATQIQISDRTGSRGLQALGGSSRNSVQLIWAVFRITGLSA